MKLASGARVLVRDEEWLVNRVDTATVGGDALWVTGVSELVRGMESIFLSELDQPKVLTPDSTSLVADDSPRYRRSRLYVEALLRRTPPSDARLYVGHRAAIKANPYQMVPAAQALRQLRPRILIADAVGLGKTIEVGILLSELIRRGRGERILVIALKSILEQFQEEFWSRFSIPLVRLDSVGIERVRTRIPANQNPFYHFNRVIISIDTLKKDEKYRRYLENCRWDAIVVDECQHVAERSKSQLGMSQRARLARLLATTSDALILTSATPHDGRPESFASLMNLLEPTAVANPHDYSREDVQGLFVRRFKKDVAHELSEQFPERKPHLERLPANDQEQAVLECLHSLQMSSDRGGGERLFRIVLLKAYLSSPAACLETLGARLKKTTAEADIAALTRLKGLLTKVGSFTKWRHLEALLGRFGYVQGKPGERVVIFSERIETLRYLHKQIQDTFKLEAGTVGLFYGSLDDQKQMELVRDFSQATGKIRILLASDAASEGINMHENCHRMVHFDIPWSLITLEQRNGRIDRYGQKKQPEITYLLTVPQGDTLKGDLRILERLIEKENEAHKNLGDVAWLMNLHEREREEERIAQAIAQQERPEDVIPDHPPEEEEDFLALLTSGADRPTASDGPLHREPLSLFADNPLDYFRLAVEELNDDLKRRGQDPIALEWYDHLPGCLALEPPSDLQRRYQYLPQEIAPSGGRVKLTLSREFLLSEREKARRDKRWCDWQLLYNSHPVAHWLGDRVLSLLSLHQAPVLHLGRGLERGQRAFLFQAVFSNQSSQPVLVVWPVVVLNEKGQRVEELLLEEFLERSGLSRELNNPGRSVDLKSLEALRPQAVLRAREVAQEKRTARADEMRATLKEQQKRLKSWAEAKKAELSEKLARGTFRREALLQEQEHVERLERERQVYITRSLTTEPQPYLRLVAVFLPLES